MTLKSEQHYLQTAMGHLLVMDWAYLYSTYTFGLLSLFHTKRENPLVFYLFIYLFLRGGGVGMKDRKRSEIKVKVEENFLYLVVEGKREERR